MTSEGEDLVRPESRATVEGMNDRPRMTQKEIDERLHEYFTRQEYCAYRGDKGKIVLPFQCPTLVGAIVACGYSRSAAYMMQRRKTSKVHILTRARELLDLWENGFAHACQAAGVGTSWSQYLDNRRHPVEQKQRLELSGKVQTEAKVTLASEILSRIDGLGDDTDGGQAKQ